VGSGKLGRLGALAFAIAFLWAPVSAGAFVYWTDNLASSVGRGSLDATNPSNAFVQASGATEGVAVDGAHVYWANLAAGTIGRANLDGSGVNQSFIPGAGQPSGVAVDGGHIYWSDENGGATGNGRIGRANLDGSGVTPAFIPGLNVPDGVAVTSARIYWANNGSDSIGSALIGGGSVNNNFITTAVSTPSGIATDGTSLYWGNLGDASIGKATVAGSGPQEVVFGLDSPTSVAVDAAHLYWTSYDANEIGRSALDGSSPNDAFITGLSGPNGLAVDAGALPPTTSIALAPAAPTGANGWYRGGVQVSVSAAQDVYPIAATRCGQDLPGPPAVFAALPASCGLTGAGVSVSTPGVHAVYASSQDTHGDAGGVVSAAFKIDPTAPKLACVGAPQFVLGSSGAAVRATVTDAGGSGAARSPVSAGVGTRAFGKKTVTLSGSDIAGNPASIKCGYTVKPKSLSPNPSFGWSATARGGATRFLSMALSHVPAGAKVKLVCSGGGCPFKSHAAAVSARGQSAKAKKKPKRPKSTFNLLPLLKGHRLHAGTKLSVSVTQKDTTGRVWVLTMQKGSKSPKQAIDCQEPGSSAVRAKCL
jgi:virginiamycin B lyase